MTNVQAGNIRVVQQDHNDKALILVLLCLSCGAGLILTLLLATYGARVLRWTTDLRRTVIWYTVLLALSIMLLLLMLPTIGDAYAQYWTDIQQAVSRTISPSILLSDYLALTFLTLPAAIPLSGGVLMWRELLKELRPFRTSEEWGAQYEKLEARVQETQERAARRAADTAEEGERTLGLLYLATPIGSGDPLPTGERSIGVLKKNGQVICADWILDEHLFVLGATGAGKSTTLLRLVYEVLKNTQRDVFIVDGKGEESFAQLLRALIWLHRGHETPIFNLGNGLASARYHAFSGSAEAIYNRLLKMIDVEKAEGGAAFYADVNRDVLQLICHAPAPFGPPRSFRELRRRLSKDWLLEAYAGDVDELETIGGWKDQQIEGLASRLRPLIRDLSHVTDADGFDLTTSHSAIFSINALSVGDTAQRFCKFFIEDMKDFVSVRTTRPGLLIIDEFGEFGNENIKSLLAQARSKGWGVVLATQEYANLGDETMARQILANTRTKILMATDYPEELGSIAGTRMQVESGIQRGPEGPTGMFTDRFQHVFKIDMNWVRQARAGQAELMRYGREVRVQVRQVVLSRVEQNLVADRVAVYEREQATQRAAAQAVQESESQPQPMPQVEEPKLREERGTFKPKQRKKRGNAGSDDGAA